MKLQLIVVIFFVISISLCQCGILNLFNGWSHELGKKNDKIMCREKRDTDEKRIKPEITNPATDNVISLLDVEEGESTSKSKNAKNSETNQGNRKTKRCSVGLVGASNPMVGSIRERLKSFSLSKRASEEGNEKLCTACASQATCRLLGKCAECNKYCKGIAFYTDDLLTPWTNQTVGMSNRMAASKKDDIFSKTLFPVSTFREGETKEIICRIVGITDTTDIETVTIWITTFSNRPPPSLNGLYTEPPKKVETTREQNVRESESSLPEVRAPFNKDDRTNMEESDNSSMKSNPDVIEGPPPFLGSQNNIDPASKASQIEELDDDVSKNAEITGAINDQPIIVQPKKFQSDESDESDELQTITSTTIPKHQSLFKSPIVVNKLRDLAKPGRNKNSLLRGDQPTSGAEDQISQINEAIQEVKTMVKNIQDEASTASEQRLLGAAHIVEVPDDQTTKSSDVPNIAKQMRELIPNRVADNIKKVNQYFINRAQDALDVIGKKDNGPTNQDTVRDDHSEITKETISNLKKMPQFVLENYQNSLNGIGTMDEEAPKDNNVEVSGRFAEDTLGNAGPNDDQTQDTSEGINTTEGVSNFIAESEQTNQNSEALSTPAVYKNKLEKYLTELKEKRQKKYSPEKYLKSSAVKSDQMSPVSTDPDIVKSELPPLPPHISIANVTDNIKDSSDGKITSVNAEVQKALVMERLQKFIEDRQQGKIGSEVTDGGPPMIDPQYFLDRIDRLTKSKKTPASTRNADGSDSVVGDSNLKTNEEFNQFLPTVPTMGKDPGDITNKFQKYLADFRDRQSSLLKPRASLETDKLIPDSALPKKDLLKDKLKQYVDNIKKPNEGTSIQPDMSLSQRMSDQFSDLNSKFKTDMNNFLGSSNDLFKKDLLKEKLKKYMDSLKKPLLPDLMRKSTDTQREELEYLKKKLDSLMNVKETNPMVNAEEEPLVSKTVPDAAPIDVRPKGAFVGDAENVDGAKDETVGSAREEDVTQENSEASEWSHSLGKIVQSSSKPQEIYFIGTGIKLPLQITPGQNGSMELSVDIDKLCSCNNATCPKNHTAIEETVGAILEKEAELNEQLQNDIEAGNEAESTPTLKHSNTKNLMENLFNHMNSRKSNLFKRSSDKTNDLSALRKRLRRRKDLRNTIVKESDLPKIPTFQEVTDELNSFNEKMQESVANSVQQLKNNAEDMEEQLEDTVVGSNQNLNPIINQNVPKIDDAAAEILNQINDEALQFNNDILKKIEDPSNDLLKSLDQNNIDNQLLKFPMNTLKQIRKQAKETLKNMKLQSRLDKITQKNYLKKLKLPSLPTTMDPLDLMNQLQENLNKMQPSIPDLQNRLSEINGDVLMADPYQSTRVNILEKKLSQLNNEIKKYHDNNEKLLAKESQKFLGGHQDEIVGKEVNIINRILTWIKSLTTSVDE